MVIRMKVLHTSDLHLGKRVHGYSMAEDQRHILDGIVGIVQERRPDAMVIAGDVYDRAVPTEEAVRMFGDFLERVTAEGCEVYVVAGNHDSGTRLEFCGPILGRNGVHISGEFTGRAEKLTVRDDHGDLSLYLLPYFKVSEVRSILGGGCCPILLDIHIFHTCIDYLGFSFMASSYRKNRGRPPESWLADPSNPGMCRGVWSHPAAGRRGGRGRSSAPPPSQTTGRAPG